MASLDVVFKCHDWGSRATKHDITPVTRQTDMIRTLRKYFAALNFAALTLLLTASSAFAGEQPFSQAAFDKLKADGAPAIVYFHATWCPTCKIQQPIVDRLSAQPDMKGVTILEADYDKEVALKRALKVTQQSTFVVFRGGHEVARSTGQTREQDILDTFRKAL